jgi:hypothetical protein
MAKAITRNTKISTAIRGNEIRGVSAGAGRKPFVIPRPIEVPVESYAADYGFTGTVLPALAGFVACFGFFIRGI